MENPKKDYSVFYLTFDENVIADETIQANDYDEAEKIAVDHSLKYSNCHLINLATKTK